MCVGFCVLCVAFGIKDSYLQHLWSVSDCLAGLPLSVNFGAKTTPREPMRPEVGGGKNQGHWSAKEKIRDVEVEDTGQSRLGLVNQV